VEEIAGYLLDNNIISILVTPGDPRYPHVLTDFQMLTEAPVFLPVIAIAEIEFGMAKAERANEAQRSNVREFFRRYPNHLGINDDTIEPYTLMRAQLWRDYGTPKTRGHKEKLPEELVDRVSGQSLGVDERDLLIASVAAQYNLVLATNDSGPGMKRIAAVALKLETAGRPISLRVEFWPKPR
jgi:predicted nucleic acid-binding protein